MDHSNFLSQTKTQIIQMMATRDEKLSTFNNNKIRLENIEAKEKELIEAKAVISFEIEAIQKTLKEDIDNLITIAIRTVYDRDIAFALAFNRKPSGASEYKPCIIENGEEFNPKDEQCGGVLDVISYAMRIVLKGFESKESRPFIFFDEPFKFLGGGVLAERAAKMMKNINDDLSIQSVIISHDQMCISSADRIYHTTHDGYKSTTKLIGKESKPEKRITRVRA